MKVRGIDYDIKSYNPEELKCCGRGLVIVNGLSDEFHIEKNKVEVVNIYVKWQGIRTLPFNFHYHFDKNVIKLIL